MSRDVLISGVGPGSAGVGRVIEYFMNNARNYTFICPPKARVGSIKSATRACNLFLIVKWFLEYFRYYLFFGLYKFNLKTIFNRNILLLHPQTLKFKNVINLIERNNVSIYVMDNSFFCLKSYNYNSSLNKPCLLCIDSQYRNAEIYKCSPFPINHTYQEYYEFIDSIKANLKRLKFLTQNSGQTELLRLQFGVDINIEEVGLLTSDIFEEKVFIDRRSAKYDIVFHGDHSLAKGGSYAFELAKQLPHYTFLFPFESLEEDIPSHITFKKMSWTSGLEEHVTYSKLTLCPSIWDAPIEGSVLKTMKLGVPLAVYFSTYAFSSEIDNGCVIKLGGIVDVDVQKIRLFMETTDEEKKKLGKKGQRFITKKIDTMVDRFNFKFG